MKLMLALIRDKQLPGRGPQLSVPLDRRVQYALDCLDAGRDEEAALKLLAWAAPRLDNPDLQAAAHEALDSNEGN